MRKLRIVSATRKDPDAFVNGSLLGRTVKGLGWDPRIEASITCSNERGLPHIYNRAIEKSREDEALLFIHDDVQIEDFHLFVRLRDAFTAFDVVGVAGNTSINPTQAGWTHLRAENNTPKMSDRSELSGMVGHLYDNERKVSFFGPTPLQCSLLDGCFIAAKSQLLRERGILFDEQFKFHFYDMDFCRTCLQKGLRLGTWPIAITHGSRGNFASPEWEAACKVYHQKWSEVS